MILHIKHYLETHGANRFIDITFADTDRTPHRVGYKKKNTNGVFDNLILAQNLEKEVCKGFNAKEVVKALMKTDSLKQKEGVRPNYKLTIPSIGLTRIYHIKASIMEYE